ncbi:uncharacterized protein LOC143902595 [Temnothorax americanus]|uniref:uncharacterized protein LOC143902595 n=1 Tax=Temnothorax americanus TaxID=1964332 RepID=UPI0040692246
MNDLLQFITGDTGARDNSRESRKGSKGEHGRASVHTITAAVFPLCRSPSSFVQSRRHASYLDRPTRPCSQSMHRRSLPLDAHLTAASVTATITPTRADYRDLRSKISKRRNTMTFRLI